MKRIGTSWLIHIFALLHAAVTVTCTLLFWRDSLLLTALTMALTIIICIRRNLTTEFTAISIIMVNIVGFIMGSMGARLLSFCHPLLQHSLSTFITTEFLGWTMDIFARRFHPSGSAAHERRLSWKKDYGWLIFAAGLVFGFRVYIDFVFAGGLFLGADVVSHIFALLDNGLSLLVMIAASIAFIRIGRKVHIKIELAASITLIFLAIVSVICAVIVTMDLPFHFNPFTASDFYRYTLVALMVESAIFSISYMIGFAVQMQKEVVSQREQRHQAEFRYLALKNQVNPHFLFNSLNVLDSIVKDGSREESSEYIHKLAGIYRYMMSHEQNRLVPLHEEVVFAKLYYELLCIRFPEGFRVENRILEEDMDKMIVPCTLQLLLENSTKHNAISPEDKPLVVILSSDGKDLSVSNNIIPRMSQPHPSTRLGLQYIRNQYRDIAGREVQVEKSDEKFTVTLPLLDD